MLLAVQARSFPESLAFRPQSRLHGCMSENARFAPEHKGAFDANALLAATGRGERAAFVELFQHYAPRVKSYLLKHGADNASAEEIVQNTFVTVWEKAKTYDPAKAAASTWIFTVARNKRIDTLRRERFIEVNTDSPALALAVAPEQDTYVGEGEAERLGAAIAALPEEQAKLLRMAFFEDKSHSAIAKETSLPLGTVKSRLRHALAKLKKTLGGEAGR